VRAIPTGGYRLGGTRAGPWRADRVGVSRETASSRRCFEGPSGQGPKGHSRRRPGARQRGSWNPDASGLSADGGARSIQAEVVGPLFAPVGLGTRAPAARTVQATRSPPGAQHVRSPPTVAQPMGPTRSTCSRPCGPTALRRRRRVCRYERISAHAWAAASFACGLGMPGRRRRDAAGPRVRRTTTRRRHCESRACLGLGPGGAPTEAQRRASPQILNWSDDGPSHRAMAAVGPID
jgi:hypothetical protein